MYIYTYSHEKKNQILKIPITSKLKALRGYRKSDRE